MVKKIFGPKNLEPKNFGENNKRPKYLGSKKVCVQVWSKVCGDPGEPLFGKGPIKSRCMAHIRVNHWVHEGSVHIISKKLLPIVKLLKGQRKCIM